MWQPMARFGLILLCAFGSFAALSLFASHLESGEICPMFGPVPACAIVLAGYCAMLSAALFRLHGTVFFAGLIPVAGLAVTGVTLEIINGDICPDGPFGIPQCMISLTMAVLALALYWLATQTGASGQSRLRRDWRR